MKKNVYAYLHTHWDREWYKEYEEFHLRLVEVFDDVLNKLSKKEIPSFYFDGQTSALEDYLEIRPEKEEIVKNLIKEKKLFIGPYYCSTDSFLVDRESIIKNLQIGINYSQKFGNTEFIAYHADTFGHSQYIPEIIKYFDIENAIFWRGLGKLNSEFLFKDLKSIYLIEGYFHDYFSAKVTIEEKIKMLERTLDRISQYSTNNILLPIGADHLALPQNIAEQIEKINNLLKNYKITLTTPFEYLEKVKNNYKQNIQYEFRSTERNFILPGVLSSRVDLKQDNSQIQWQLARIIQPLQAISTVFFNASNNQSTIDYLYKKLIQNHAHDSIYGCSTDNVHATNKMRFKEVKEGINAITNTIKRDLYNEKDFSVLNMSNYDFSGALQIKTTNKIPKEFNAQLIEKTNGFPLTKLYRINETPITEDYTQIYEYLLDINKIKALSCKKITIEDINFKSKLKITSDSIENENILLKIDNNGINITSKKSNQKLTNFIKIVDRADIGDSYNFGALKNDKPINAKIVKTKIKEKGHIRSVLEIIFEINIPATSYKTKRSKTNKKHHISLLAILENQSDYVEFVANWKNKSTNHILQIEFNLPKAIQEVTSDDLCGYTTRKWDNNYNIYDHIPAQKGIELKHNIAPIQTHLLTQNIGIVTEGLQEYEIEKNNLRLTILRATGIISNPQNPTRGTPAGPPIETPDLQMLGTNKARFAVCVNETTNDVQKITEKFYNTTLLLNANIKDKTFFEIDNPNVQISTIKTNQTNDLIIRLVNKSNKNVSFKFKTCLTDSQILELDATENTEKEFVASMNANAIKTIRLKNNIKNH